MFILDQDFTTQRVSNVEWPKKVEGSGLKIDLQFEQETTVKTPSVSDIFTEPSSSTAFEIGSNDFSTPPESPRTFDTSKFFNKNINLPSNSFSNPKKFKPFSKNTFQTVNEDKKEVLDDIFNILEDKPISSTPEPKVVVNEKRLPFTVVRVSSSVSQIRPNSNENDILVSGKVLDDDKDIEEESGEKNVSPTRPLFFPTRPLPKTTTKEDIDLPIKSKIVPVKQKPEKKKALANSGSRQPFLKPIAKFPDIRIPSLDKKNNNNIKRPRPFDFNRGGAGKGRPLSPVLGFRTTTEATTTSISTTTEAVELESSTPVVTTRASTARTFGNIFNRFSFATEKTTTSEPIEAIKSLLDLIPKDVEVKETTSSRSLLDLIPISNLDESSFDFEDDRIDNEISQEDDGSETNTLRASLDIIPIKSTTDRNNVTVICVPIFWNLTKEAKYASTYNWLDLFVDIDEVIAKYK